jgi:hypothetical protein
MGLAAAPEKRAAGRVHPMAVRERAVRELPAGLRELPAGLREPPAGLREPPAGLREPPVRERAVPAALEAPVVAP